MLRFALLSLLFALPAQAEIVVPSGRALDLYSLRVIPQPENSNLLFVGLLSEGLDPQAYETAAQDMDVLCHDLALPEAAAQAGQGVSIDEVTIRLADRALGYGETDPEAIQFMAFYEITSGECIWH